MERKWGLEVISYKESLILRVKTISLAWTWTGLTIVAYII